MILSAKSSKDPLIYQLKITLEGARPPSWRRVLVPSGIRLDALHTVIQIAMGWTDSHLHEFVKGGNKWTLPDPEEYSYSRKLDEREFQLHELLAQVGDKLQYVYDFGDCWRHKVLEKILPESGGPRRPSCVGGKHTGQAEDCDPDGEYEIDVYEFSVAAVDAALAQERWPAGSMGEDSETSARQTRSTV